MSSNTPSNPGCTLKTLLILLILALSIIWITQNFCLEALITAVSSVLALLDMK